MLVAQLLASKAASKKEQVTSGGGLEGGKAAVRVPGFGVSAAGRGEGKQCFEGAKVTA